MRTLLPLVGNLFRQCVCVFFGVVFGAALTRTPAAERKNTRPVLDPPPPAMPQSVTTPRGQSVEIPLRIFGVQNDSLRYLIKTPPAHGKLAEPRPVSRAVWTVTYEPPTDLAVKADRFTFSVQNRAGVSAPVEVTISIVDQPSRLAVPHTIEFPETLAGMTAVKEIEIANKGGGVVAGELAVDPPFKIEGRRTYRLEGGDYAYFKIIFAPTEGGVYQREVRYSSDREFVTSLVGASQAPISAEPEKVDLRHAANSTVRTGDFALVNRTSEPLTFRLKASPRLQIPDDVTVPAGGRTALTVSMRPDDVGAVDEEVRVESSGFSLAVPVRAIKLGPILRAVPASLALGRVDAARGAQAAVELQNIGGTSAKVTGEVGAPFSLGESTFDLAPGAKKRVTLSIQPSDAKRYRAWLKFRTVGSSIELEVDAELVAAGGAMAAAGDAEKEKKRATSPADQTPWEPDMNVAKAIRVTGITSTSANIEWPIDFNGASRYRVDRLMLTRDSARKLVHAWLEIPKTTFNRKGSQWVASMSGLEPQQSQTIRVVPLDPEGKVGPELFRLDFYTLPKRTLPKPKLVPTLLIALVLVMGAIVWKRVRRQFGTPVSGL